jgi:RNA 3'-terminal phosphate cyclase (ATP)
MSNDELILDASHGEGGGQVLRTALGLAVALRRPVRLARIRIRRQKPGLQPQHLTVVRALAAISDATVQGDALDSTELSFVPQSLHGGDYHFDVGAIKGSAGSVSLVFQALLLPLVFAETPSRLTLIGGTHVPWSPPIHYLAEVFLPALAESCLHAALTLHRWGWYPGGGGEVEATIAPVRRVRGFTLSPPDASMAIIGLSAVSRLPRSIAERQRQRAQERLAAAGLTGLIGVEEGVAFNPGTVLFLAISGHAGFTALGRRGLPAERVADAAVDQFLAWRATGAAVDDQLADQLLPFLALASGDSSLTCPTLSPHLRTVAWLVQEFLPVRVALTEGRPASIHISPGQ